MQQPNNLSSFLKIGLSSTAMSLVVMASVAQAQQVQTAKPTTADSDVQLNTINIKTTNPQDITSRPAPVSTISKTEIKLNGREKLDTVLRSTPGVFTSINGSNPGVAVNIRGFEGSGRVNMMIDGAPQTFRTTAHDAQGYSYIDPNLLSSVDINRGAVTTEGGSGLAGSVNFKTLGVDDVIMEGKNKGVLGRASWGSNGVGFSEMLAGAARINEIGIVAAISRRDSNDYKNGDGLIVDESGQELTSGLFKAEMKNDAHKLTLGGVIYNNTYGTYGSFGPGSVILSEILLQNRTFTANYNYNPADNDLIDLSVNAYHNFTKLTYQKGSRTTIGREITNESTGISVANTSRFTFNDLYLDWKYGLEYNHDNTGGFKVGPNPIDSTSDRAAIFTQAEWAYGDLQVLTGLRYDYFKLENDEAGVKNSDGRLNPKVTVAYNVTNWLQPYVTYAHSSRAPTLQETMLGGEAHGNGSMQANPNLQPENQRGWEFGLNIAHSNLLTPEDNIKLKANYYTMRVENYIASAYIPDPSAPNNPRAGYRQFINTPGTSDVSGFELEAQYDAGFAFGGIAYTHAKSKLPEQTPGLGANQYLPENIITLNAGARFLDRKLETGIRYQHVSSGETLTSPGAKTDPYDLVDIFATYKFNENVDLSLKVTNLFDKQYTPSLSTYGSGQGRTFVVATQFQF